MAKNYPDLERVWKLPVRSEFERVVLLAIALEKPFSEIWGKKGLRSDIVNNHLENFHREGRFRLIEGVLSIEFDRSKWIDGTNWHYPDIKEVIALRNL
jgi:hypothetical protein